MSRSGLPPTIFLEFARDDGGLAALGTDTIHYVDGRHSRVSAVDLIQEHARQITKNRPELTLVGYARPGDYSGRIYNL